MTITRQEFLEWQTNSVTEAFISRIRQDREDMKEGLCNGAYENPEEVMGRCKVLAILLDLRYEDLVPQVWNPNQQEQESE